MWLSTSTGTALSPNGIAVAKKSGLPGTRSSGALTYGTMCSVGWRVHAAAPASAIDAPISRRKLRRPAGSLNSDAPSGNSRWSMAWNSEVSATSSRLRQKAGPFLPARRSRIAERSMSRMEEVLSSRAVLPVARRTAGEALHVVLLHELAADRELVAGGPIPHLVDRFLRAQEAFGR